MNSLLAKAARLHMVNFTLSSLMMLYSVEIILPSEPEFNLRVRWIQSLGGTRFIPMYLAFPVVILFRYSGMLEGDFFSADEVAARYMMLVKDACARNVDGGTGSVTMVFMSRL
jgi:hypothetical protein